MWIDNLPRSLFSSFSPSGRLLSQEGSDIILQHHHCSSTTSTKEGANEGEEEPSSFSSKHLVKRLPKTLPPTKKSLFSVSKREKKAREQQQQDAQPKRQPLCPTLSTGLFSLLRYILLMACLPSPLLPSYCSPPSLRGMCRYIIKMITLAHEEKRKRPTNSPQPRLENPSSVSLSRHAEDVLFKRLLLKGGMFLPFFKKRVSDPDFVFPCNKVHVFHSLFVQFKRFSFFFHVSRSLGGGKKIRSYSAFGFFILLLRNNFFL